jgi:hypothetical protein
VYVHFVVAFLIVAVAVLSAALVAALGYYLRDLRRQVDTLEETLHMVGSTDYIRWAAEHESNDPEPNGTPAKQGKRRHLHALALIPLTWAADRVARRPMVAAAMVGALVAFTLSLLPETVDDSEQAPPVAAAPPRGDDAETTTTSTTSSTTTTSSVPIDGSTVETELVAAVQAESAADGEPQGELPGSSTDASVPAGEEPITDEPSPPPTTTPPTTATPPTTSPPTTPPTTPPATAPPPQQDREKCLLDLSLLVVRAKLLCS